MARNKGTTIVVGELSWALGVDPNNCLELKLNWKAGDLVTLDARIIATDAEEKHIIKDGEMVIALRTWTEGRSKRYVPIFGDARDDALPTLYERIEGT